MEGSITLWMSDIYSLEKIRHPYQRTYRDDKQARWESDSGYCDNYGKLQKLDIKTKFIRTNFSKTNSAIRQGRPFTRFDGYFHF